MAKGETIEPVNDEPVCDHDKLFSEIFARAKEERARKIDAGESAAETKKFLDETKLNSQAHSWGRSIIKKLDMKDGENKAMDVIRSLNFLLPMLENHVVGQGTSEMDLDAPEPDKAMGKPTADVATPEDDGEEMIGEPADAEIAADDAAFTEAADDLGEPADAEDHFEREDA